jgi:GAF domain-containing protein
VFPLVVVSNKSVVIHDMSKVPCCKDKEYISGWPYFRFFGEVPIKTRSGLVVGSFCLLDNVARHEFGEENLKTLKEIASAVARHLELVQAQKNLERSKDMVKALGLFAEGKPTLRQWWTDAFNRRASNTEAREPQKEEPTPEFK